MAINENQLGSVQFNQRPPSGAAIVSDLQIIHNDLLKIIDEEDESVESNLLIQRTIIPVGEIVDVPAGFQAIAYGTYTVNGTLTVEGEMRVTSWPT